MGTLILVFAGEYDLASRPQLRDEFAALNDAGRIVFDMTSVSYFSCACIGEMIRLHNLRIEEGKDPLAVVLGAPILKRVFDTLALDKVFQVANALGAIVPESEETVTLHAVPGDDVLPINPHDRMCTMTAESVVRRAENFLVE